MFNPEDDVNSDEEDNDADADHGSNAMEEQDSGFGSQAELQALHRQRAATVTTARERALSLFKKATSISEEEEDDDDYSYTVTIPKSRMTAFNLAVRYVSHGTSFRMASNVIGCNTYDVLGNPGLRACSRQDVSKSIRVICAVNMQRIARHLRSAWGFSIALDSATHRSTSYLDLRFREFIRECNNIVNLHGCALPMFDRRTGKHISSESLLVL